MAVFQGARLRGIGIPVRRADQRTNRARIAPTRTLSPPRVRPAGLLMAVILIGTMLGLVYLTQTLASNATSLEIQSLANQSQELNRQLLNQRSKVEFEADADRIVSAAKGIGLVKLGDGVVLEAP